MGYTNVQMEAMLASLDAVMERRDVIGYAAARNARALGDELREFREFRDGLVAKHGDEEVGEGGEPTGRVSVSPASAGFAAFMEELAPIAGMEHEPRLTKLPYADAIGELSGTELLALDWMFCEEGREGKD